jgi:RNA polymerase primary sigma factor
MEDMVRRRSPCDGPVADRGRCVKTDAGRAGQPAGTALDRDAGTGRAVWLRERLAELAHNLGRVPNTNELHSFILRYQVDPAEIDALVGGSDARASSQKASTAPPARRPVSIPEARRSAEPPVLRPVAALPLLRTPEPSETPPSDPDGLPRPEIARTSDKVIRRAVDDLVDDWYRAGRALRYDDVTRLTTKRELSAEQTAIIREELEEQGVELAGLRTERRVDEGLVDDEDEDGRRPAAAVSELVRAYLLKIGEYPLIWADDEVRLGRQIRLGLDADAVLRDESRCSDLSAAALASLRDASAAGRRAHSEMVCANLRLVVSIARHRSFEGSGVEFIDRVQDGNAGLMHAADKFDPTLGYKFSTYATWWIRQAITRGIGDRGRLIRLPVHVHEKLSLMRRVRRDLTARLDRDPTVGELADALEWPAATVQAMRDFSQPVVSLDVLVGTEGDTTLGDLLSDRADIDGRTDPVNCVIESAVARDLDRALAVLSERAADVVRRRFGLHGAPKQTLDEIGLHFGVTRERIRQIEAKAMARLRLPQNLTGLRSYLFEDSEQPPLPPVAQGRRRSTPNLGSTSATVAEPVLEVVSAAGQSNLDREQFLAETVSDIVGAS